MVKRFLSRNKVILWQALFIGFGTSWLLAPALNHLLNSRLSLISQFEIASQPYGWLFRLGDALAALLLIAASYYLFRSESSPTQKTIFKTLMLVGGLMLIDPIITTTCQRVGANCIETITPSFLVHGAESILLAVCVFGLSLFDATKRKAFTSQLFVSFQILYGLLALLRYADIYRFATLSQFVYQYLVIVWLAWFVGRYLYSGSIELSKSVTKKVQIFFGLWAYINGFLAIIISLAHIHVFGILRGVYFASDTAWLAQHGVVVGVILLYISRHVWRGEHRARQLFLVVLFIETIKYSVVTPNVPLLALYGTSFVGLFVMADCFLRGSENDSWSSRLREAGTLLFGATLAFSLAVILISQNSKRFEVLRESIRHYSNFVITSDDVPRHLLRSSLLAHTITALFATTLLLVLWSLFRPSQTHNTLAQNENEDEHVEAILSRYATSSEDYFKLWPKDKHYFFYNDGFIAYKVTKTIVFALADPIASTLNDQKIILGEFMRVWSTKGFRVCFVLIGESSKHLYQDASLQLLQIGSSAVIDIHRFNGETVRNKWWRWQINRAVKNGYHYQASLAPHDDALISQLQTVSDQWLTRPGHQEQGFAMGNFNKDYLNKCTVHYLMLDGNVVAFANQVPVFGGLTQATVDMIRFNPEYQNTMPYLLAQLIKQLGSEERYKTFDLGFVPLAHTKGPLANIIKILTASRYSASGLAQFKNKFEPTWQKNYIAYDGDMGDLAAIALNAEEALQA